MFIYCLAFKKTMLRNVYNKPDSSQFPRKKRLKSTSQAEIIKIVYSGLMHASFFNKGL